MHTGRSHGQPWARAGLLSCLLLLSSEARADSFDRHYQQAMAHARAGRYEAAAEAMTAAYELRRYPRLLYNLGQLHRQLGHVREAVRCFERFLAEERDVPTERRAEVERFLAELRPAATPPAPPVPPAAPSPPSPTPPSTPSPTTPHATFAPPAAFRIVLSRVREPPRAAPVYRRWWLWTPLAVVTVAGVVTGVVLATRPQGPGEPPLPQVPIHDVSF